jgi:hypothetical protein
MSTQRLALSLALLAVGLGLVAKPVSAAGKPASPATVICGAIDPTTKQPVRGTLVLNKQTSHPNHAFKRSKHPADLSLDFAISGCKLGSRAKRPRFRVLPANGASELPKEAVSRHRAWYHDGSTGTLVLTVDPHKFGGGRYAALVGVRAPYLAGNSTQITVSRTDGWRWPLVIGLLAGLVGALWFLLLKGTSKTKLAVSWLWLIPLILVAAGVGAWAAVTNYWSQEVWTFDDDWVSTAKLAFAAASTGSLAGVLAAVWQAPTPAEADEKRAAKKRAAAEKRTTEKRAAGDERAAEEKRAAEERAAGDERAADDKRAADEKR